MRFHCIYSFRIWIVSDLMILCRSLSLGSESVLQVPVAIHINETPRGSTLPLLKCVTVWLTLSSILCVYVYVGAYGVVVENPPTISCIACFFSFLWVVESPPTNFVFLVSCAPPVWHFPPTKFISCCVNDIGCLTHSVHFIVPNH